MSKLREIKRRISSVNNISQVTHAMQMVAASRMRKTQEGALRGKPYAEKIRELMQSIIKQQIGNSKVNNKGDQENTTFKSIELHPLLDPGFSSSSNVLLVVYSPQRGLAGSLPTNLLRFVQESSSEIKKSGKNLKIITVGNKLRDSLARRGFDIVADFSNMPEYPTTGDIRPLTKIIEDLYMSGEVGVVKVVYPDFVNAIVQRPTLLQLIPIDVEAVNVKVEDTSSSNIPHIFEPDMYTVFDHLVPNYLETLLYQAKLETVASEYSARMVAMKSATENAKGLKFDLTLAFNKSRQAQITQEIAEVVSGM